MMNIEIEAYVAAIEGNRSGDRSEKVRVTATYEAANTHSSLTFEVPLERASEFHVGQRLVIQLRRGAGG